MVCCSNHHQPAQVGAGFQSAPGLELLPPGQHDHKHERLYAARATIISLGTRRAAELLGLARRGDTWQRSFGLGTMVVPQSQFEKCAAAMMHALSTVFIRTVPC